MEPASRMRRRSQRRCCGWQMGHLQLQRAAFQQRRRVGALCVPSLAMVSGCPCCAHNLRPFFAFSCFDSLKHCSTFNANQSQPEGRRG